MQYAYFPPKCNKKLKIQKIQSPVKMIELYDTDFEAEEEKIKS